MKGNGFDPRHHHNGRFGDSKEPPVDDADEIKDRMAEVRRGLRADAVQIARSAQHAAQQATDWKFYVQKFPLAVAGAALIVGYALVPAKQKRGPLVATDDQLQRLAKVGQLKVVAETPAAEKGGLVKKAMFALGGLALRAALDHMGQTLAVRANANGPKANGHPSQSREF